MLTVTLSTLLLAASPSHSAAAQVTTIVEEPFDEQASLPDGVVFFFPKSSDLSPVADEIIARVARRASSRTVVLVQTFSDQEAGETTQMAAERGDAVRLELVRDGVPASAIRMTHAGVSRTGIESRRVSISLISVASSSPRVATAGGVPVVVQ